MISSYIIKEATMRLDIAPCVSLADAGGFNGKGRPLAA